MVKNMIKAVKIQLQISSNMPSNASRNLNQGYVIKA